MCRIHHIYYPGCGHTGDDILYMCPEASRLSRPCEHPVRLASPYSREKFCPDCRPNPETWTETTIGYIIMNSPWITWLLIYGLYSAICFIVQKACGLVQALHGFIHGALKWLSSTSQTLVSNLNLNAHRLASLAKLIVCTYLWAAVKSFLWWTVAIAFTPFIVILPILEILEDGLLPHVPKLFWKIVDFCTGEGFKLYAVCFLAAAYLVAPAFSVKRWLEIITKILAPFQAVKLYTWYMDEAWDMLGDFWAPVTFATFITLVLTSLFMNAPHVSVLSFLNRWVYAILFILTIAEPTWTLLGLLYAYTRTGLPRVMRQDMVQRGSGRVGQDAVQNRLASIPQIRLAALKRSEQLLHDRLRNRSTPPRRDSAVQTGNVEALRGQTAPAYPDSAMQTGSSDVPRNQTAAAYQDSALQTGREDVRYAGQSPVRWRRGSYERRRPT